MLRQLLKLFSFGRQEPTVIDQESDKVVLYATVESSKTKSSRSALSPAVLPDARPLPPSSRASPVHAIAARETMQPQTMPTPQQHGNFDHG